MRVVLCEDHAALRQIVRETCTAAGIEVVGETDRAEEAAALAAQEAADVVVLDLSSGETPSETIRPVTELVPAAAIVAYTGVPAADLDAAAARALAGHVAKTAPLSELVAEIERAGGR
ncbi:MAG: response regulator [Solirubrobacteraceae bacterium]